MEESSSKDGELHLLQKINDLEETVNAQCQYILELEVINQTSYSDT